MAAGAEGVSGLGLSRAYRIATRMAIAHVKKGKQWKTVESHPQLLAAVPDPSAAHPGEVDAAFLEITDRVSPASRAVLLLHYQQHLSLEEKPSPPWKGQRFHRFQLSESSTKIPERTSRHGWKPKRETIQ